MRLDRGKAIQSLDGLAATCGFEVIVGDRSGIDAWKVGLGLGFASLEEGCLRRCWIGSVGVQCRRDMSVRVV